jgi:hypothetical protein
MDDPQKPGYYRAVPGSRELITGARRSDEALQALEAANPSADPANPSADPAPLLLYRGEWLGGARFLEGISIPPAVFDRLAPLQSALEQLVYLQLFRLSYGQGRNFCRVGKRELGLRAGLSDRRLNVVLDGLVRKGHLKPLHRDTLGTLYRVFLPSEALRIEPESGLKLGERQEPPPATAYPVPPAPAPAPRSKKKPAARPAPGPKSPTNAPAKSRPARKPRARPLESPLNEERFADVVGKPVRGPGLAEMLDRFFAARKVRAGQEERQLGATVLTELLEDGFSRTEVLRAIEWFLAHMPEERTLDRLPYFIAQALEK